MIAPSTAALAGFVAGLLSMWIGIVAVLAAIAYYIIDAV